MNSTANSASTKITTVIDVTTDLTGRVVDGSPNERQTVTELWTFVRARGGSWLLSAIQQAFGEDTGAAGFLIIFRGVLAAGR